MNGGKPRILGRRRVSHDDFAGRLRAGGPRCDGLYKGAAQSLTSASAGSGLDQNQRFVQELDIPGQWWATFHSRPLNDLIEDPGQLRARRRLMLRPYDTKCPIKYQLLQ